MKNRSIIYNVVLSICFLWALAVICVSEHRLFSVSDYSPLIAVRQSVSVLKSIDLEAVKYVLKHIWMMTVALLFVLNIFSAGNIFFSKNGGVSPLIPAGCGAAVFAYGGFFIASAGLASPNIFRMLFIGISAFSVYNFIKTKQYERFNFDLPPFPAVFTVIFLVLGFFITSLPELFYDSLVYHLAIPKMYLMKGFLVRMPYNFFQTLTGISEHLFIWLLALGGSEICRAFTFLAGILTLLVFHKSVKEHFGAFTANAMLLIILAIPMLMINFMSTVSEVPAMFYICASMVCIMERGKLKSYDLLALFFLGCAVAVKYTSLFGLPVLLIWVYFLKKVKIDISFALKGAAVFLMPVIPHFIRNAVFTGNPFYPYMAGYLGWVKLEPDLLAAWKSDLLTNSVWGVLDFARIIWDAGLHGVARHDFLGPVVLALAVFVFFVKKEKRNIALIISAAAVFLIEAQFTNVLRLFIPFVCLFALALSAALDNINCRKALYAVLFVCVAFNIYWQFIFAVSSFGGFVVKYRSNNDNYLSTTVKMLYPPSCYPGYLFLKQSGKYKKVLIVGDARSFYCPIESVANTVFNKPLLMELFEKNRPEDCADLLKKQGFDSILINRSELNRVYSYKCPKDTYFENIKKMLVSGAKQIFEYEWILMYEL